MAGEFDPYHTWLGIASEEQPPNCYRLLGLRLFEDDPAVIENAADQRMGHLKTFQAGKHATEAQRLLNQLAGARVRLLNPEKKAAYDGQLRREMETRSAAPQTEGQRDGTGLCEASGGSSQQSGPASLSVPAGEQATATWAGLGQLGEYQLLEKLGEGGMGAVYKALHTKLKRVVAAKVLPRDRRWDDRAVVRFEREMVAAGAVDHANIVRAMDAREVDGTRFLVMEYVDGLDLNALGRGCHPIAVADVCEIVRQVALGLEEVRRHGLVHRDIKPSNIMLTAHGTVKILDLGLARFGEDKSEDEELTGSGTALGTLDYMAPEQVSDSRSVDIRADIYSLGCTLYKLLSGQSPFAGPKYRTPMEKMNAHLKDPVPPVETLRRDVPEELAGVLDRMLAKDPVERYAVPAQVVEAVGRFTARADLIALSGASETRTRPRSRSPATRDGNRGYAVLILRNAAL